MIISTSPLTFPFLLFYTYSHESVILASTNILKLQTIQTVTTIATFAHWANFRLHAILQTNAKIAQEVITPTTKNTRMR